jgi:nitrate reductase gamma subunit
MLLHLLSANTVMLLLPFTKIAHCVLQPMSQLVTALSWKFVPGAGDRVAATLGYANRPSWVEKPRVGDSQT